MPKKVLMLLLNSFKNDNRVLKEASSLAKAGYKIKLLCYQEYDMPLKENKNGFKVLRIVNIGNYHKLRILSKLYFLFKFTFKSLLIGKHDIIHCHDLFTLPIGFLHKLFYKSKIIYDCHEHETETAHLSGMVKILYKIIERIFIKRADAVITVSESIAASYVDIYNIKKPTIVMNCPELVNIKKNTKLRRIFNIPKNELIFLYQGVLEHNRGVSKLIEVFKKIKEKHIVFIGYGIEKDKIIQASRIHKNIHFHETVPYNELLEYTCSANFGLIVTDNRSLSVDFSLPNKLFEYVMSGIPVICSNLREVSKFVKTNNLGICLDENSIEYLVNTLGSLTQRDSIKFAKNLKQAKSFYNWENQAYNLVEAYKSLENAN